MYVELQVDEVCLFVHFFFEWIVDDSGRNTIGLCNDDDTAIFDQSDANFNSFNNRNYIINVLSTFTNDHRGSTAVHRRKL